MRKADKYKLQKENKSLTNFGFSPEELVHNHICPNCKELHEILYASDKKSTYIFCKNFSWIELRRYNGGRAFIINLEPEM
jgi:hypothetical protein